MEFDENDGHNACDALLSVEANDRVACTPQRDAAGIPYPLPQLHRMRFLRVNFRYHPETIYTGYAYQQRGGTETSMTCLCMHRS